MSGGTLVLASITFAVMLVGLAGVVLPVIPDVWLIWLAALAYGLLAGFSGWIGGVAMALLTILTVVGVAVDLVVGHAAAKKGGASWQAIAASIVLGLVGLLYFPPLGSLAGALLGLFIVEYLRRGRNVGQAWIAVKSYAAGCGWSMVLRGAIAVLMIAIWVAWVFLASR